MSKTLVIIRHAEALDKAIMQTDYDRQLSDKGKKDAEAMAQFLFVKEIKPQLIITSSAQRTTETALIFSRALKLAEDSILLDFSLYNAPSESLKEAVCCSNIPDSIDSVFLIAHNPAVSIFTMEYTHDLGIGNIPPCGVIVMKLNIEKWSDFSPLTSTLQFYKFPSN